MSDWRGDDSSRKKEKPQRKSMPVIPRRDDSSKPKGEPRNWTGKPVEASEEKKEVKRSWTSEPSTESPSFKMSWRKLFLWLLTPAVAITTIVFLYFISNGKDAEMPLLMIVADDRQPSELGELGFADSFATSTSVTKVLTPSENVLQIMRDDNANWLRRLNDSTGPKDYLRVESNPLVFRGGGPKQQFIAFYVNCVAVRRDQELILVPSSRDSTFSLACDTDRSQKQPLSLTEALRHLARATPTDSIAVVGLDVRTASPIYNLGDIGFPYDEFQRAFDRLEEAEKKKLILFLPCGAGEESWLFPKTGMTVFGTIFLTGLTEMFGQQDLSLGSFKLELQERVSRWVLQNRKSKQLPSIICHDVTWKEFEKRPFLGLFTALPKPKVKRAPESQNLAGFYKDLNGLWQRYEAVKLESLEPNQLLALASLEAHLLLLEDVVEYAPEAWRQMVDSAEECFKSLKPLNLTYRVSWIEDGTGTDRKQDSDDLENLLRSTLKQEIDTGSSKNEEQNKRVEEILALLIERWQEIQVLATQPRREISWWLEESIHKLDEEFLKSVDEFIGNNLQVARNLAVNSKSSIDKVNIDLKTLSEGLSLRDEASSVLPHALAFLIRTDRFSTSEEERREIEEKTKQLAEIAADLDRMELDFAELNLDSIDLKVKPACRKKVNEVKEWMQTKIQVWLSKEGIDPETIRNLRVAVRCPFLRVEAREKAHERLVRRFEEEGDSAGRSDSSQNSPADLPPSNEREEKKANIADLFLRSLPSSTSPEHREYWETILRGDLRDSKFWNITSLKPPKDYRELYANAHRIRRIAGALGMHSVSRPDVWRDSCAQKVLDSFTALSELRYRRLQRERLLLARWGSPEEDVSRIQTAFRFEELAKKYDIESLELRKRILPDWNFEAAADHDLDNRFQTISNELKRMSECLNAEVEGGAKVRVKWTADKNRFRAEPWEQILPVIKIADYSVPSSSQRFSLSKENARIVDLTPYQDVSPENVPVSIAFRGHRLRASAISPQVLFAGKHRPRFDAEITATIKNEKRSVVILLDCSGSMSKSERMEKAEIAVKKLIEIFKDSASTGQEIDVSLVVLGVFSTEPELKEHDFQAGRIGNNYLGYFLGENGARFSHIAHTDFVAIRADKSTLQRWDKLLAAPFVAPGLNTPLYDAIEFSCQCLLDRAGSGTRELVILSDGGDEIGVPFTPEALMKELEKKNQTPYYLKSLKALREAGTNSSPLFTYQGPKGDCAQAIQKVINTGVKLYFYQVTDNQAESEAEKQAAEQAKLFVSELKNLRDRELLQTPPEETYNDFSEIVKRIQADFALPEIRVHYRDPSFGEDSSISFLSSMPTKIRSAPISLKVTKNQGEELTERPLDIEAFGGQHVQVEFHAKERELTFRTSKDLKEDHRFEASLNSKTDQENDSASPEYRMNWDFRRNEAGEGAFNLRIDLRRKPDRKSLEYLPWPRFTVGKLIRDPQGEQSPSARSAILFTDLGFDKGHYPTLEFSLENVRERAWETSGGTLDLWWSFADANKLFGARDDIRKVVRSDVQSDEFRGWTITRNKSSLRVERELPLGQEKYHWVLCPDAVNSVRTYRDRADRSDRWMETHEFELSEPNGLKDVDFYILSEDDLEKYSQESLPESQRLYWYNGKK